MSLNSFPKIDQKEYLKKYLSGDKVKKKKKDKKHKKSSAAFVKVKVIDDDINNLNTGTEIDEELLLTGDDAPQIVGEYIEENPGDRKVPKWKSIVIKDEPEDDSDVKQNDSDLWGRKSEEVRIKQEFAVGETRSKGTYDHSPPRRKHLKRKSSDLSPPRSSRKSPSTIRIKIEPKSPPHRENEHSNSSDASPPRRRKSDQSPPRRRKSPSNRSRYQSPARHRQHSGRSPRRRNKSSDQSPPRQRRSNSDQSPPRRPKKASEDSLTRKSKHRRETPDNSPPRKSRRTPDQSPPRRRRNLDESPHRKNRNSPSNYSRRTADQSPSRRSRKSSVESHRNGKIREKRTPDSSPRPRRSRWEKQESEKSPSPPPTHKPKPGKTLDGKKSGLQDGKALQKEAVQRRKKEDILFATMSSDISGRNAEVNVRSTGRKGRRAKAADEEDPEERRRKEEHEEKKKILYDRWGKGLKQIEDHKNRMLEQQYESSKPLARYSNDEDLERHLKEQERAEDPMLDYMRQKRKEKEKQSGKPQIPRYEGPYPENRFGIRPGYRWDGVDRSNGYEKKYFAVQNEKVARQDEAYKYSVEDM